LKAQYNDTATTSFRQLWKSAAIALFNTASCDALRGTRRLADIVFEAQTEAESAPSRAELRARLTRIAALSDELAVLFDSHAVRGYAPDVADALAQSGASSSMVLGRIRRLVERRLDLVPGGAGRIDAAAASGRPTPHVQCAASIAEVWRQYRGRQASHTDDEARMACAALWRLADGRVKQREKKHNEVDGDRAAEMWDRHLRTVTRRPAKEPTRRKRGEPAKLGSRAAREALVWTARDRARSALRGSRVQNPPDY
jgi:hypothetical protein